MTAPGKRELALRAMREQEAASWAGRQAVRIRGRASKRRKPKRKAKR